MNREVITERTVRAAAAHPYLLALGLCLSGDLFFFASVENIPGNALWIETALVLAAAAGFALVKLRAGDFDRRRFGLFLGSVSVAVFMGLRLYVQSGNKALYHFAGGCGAVLLLFGLARSRRFQEQLNSLMIMGLGFFVKVYYVLVTSCYTRQHDVRSFGGPDGHAGYIEYLLFNRGLPDFDVRERYQFCHPPLHHAVSALWIYINENLFLTGHDQARESLQTLSLFYTLCIVISAYKLLRHFGLSGRALNIPLLIISFHPSFILLSGSINNDPLSAALTMGAAVCTLEWYKDRSLKNILKIALCVGLGMMAKLSAAVIAPAIAVVFLTAFLKYFRREGKALFAQFAAFGSLCIPLGLWFGIRNYVKWGVPLTYVQELSVTEPQYLGDRSFLSRITDFSLYQLKSPFEQWAESGSYNEFSPLPALLKTSLFGEFINEDTFAPGSFVIPLCTVLFWLNVLIAAAALAAMIAFSLRKTAEHTMDRRFLFLFHVSMIAGFISAAKAYPFTCTMNFRYMTPSVVTGSVFIGLLLKSLSGKDTGPTRAAAKAIDVSVSLFALCASVIYLSLTG